jgi:hypothetical protein
MFSVAIYLVDLRYGGPEEGGRYYHCGTPVEELFEELPKEHQLPRFFHDEAEAIKFANAVQLSLDATVNKGRREISSVLSEGMYHARVEDGLPKHFPRERPRYE